MVCWSANRTRLTRRPRDAPGETGDAAPLLDAELAGPGGAAQRREALVRDARRARHELQQPQPPLVVEAVDGRPEPLDHRVQVVVTWETDTVIVIGSATTT